MDIGFLHFQTIVLFAQRVQLTWTPPDAQNISHYAIYRTTHQDSTFVLLNTVNSPNSTYLDEAILSNVHYFWVVTTIDKNGNESDFSNIVDTTIVKGVAAPSIITQPRNATVRVGETAQFSLVAGGALPIAYQWQQNGSDIPGATNATYTTPKVTIADNGSRFRCVATNLYGSATSVEAKLTVVSGTGRRVADGQIVLYAFEEGNGAVVKDVSGIGAPLNLIVSNGDAVSWIPGGLSINSPTMVASAGAATKIIGACKASNEITIEAWIKPANATQNGPARIVSLSADPFNRNFTLGQGLTDVDPPALYGVRLRTTATSDNGVPALNTPDGSITTQLSHVVYTRNASGTARIYVNNVLHASETIAGDLSNWNDSFPLTLANESTEDRPWQGEFHLVAIFNRAFNLDEVSQNFVAGPRADIRTGLDESVSSPVDEFQLYQNHPNPFGSGATSRFAGNPSTSISYSLPQRNHVDLTIYDLNSRQVYNLVDAFQEAGRYTVIWNGIDAQGKPVPSGVYFYRLRTLNSSSFRRMVLVK